MKTNHESSVGQELGLASRLGTAARLSAVEAPGESAPMSPESLDRIRDRLYPQWWMFRALEGQTLAPAQRPLYRVVCSSPDERELAYKVRPSFVDAEIVLKQ